MGTQWQSSENLFHPLRKIPKLSGNPLLVHNEKDLDI
jgi:hypothetical protein